jgi:hypothetical protein
MIAILTGAPLTIAEIITMAVLTAAVLATVFFATRQSDCSPTAIVASAPGLE